VTELAQLWLPLLLSSILVYILSSIIHMAPLWHRGDYPRLPEEEKFRNAVRPLGIPPGEYMVPRASSMKEMKEQEFEEKMKSGPVMMMTVYPNGRIGMGKSLLLWFIYCGVVGLFSAYLTGRALPPGAAGMQVFRFTSTVAFAGYTLALWQASIWYNRPWSSTFKSTIDGLLYAFATGAVYAWLWPGLL
jgi:hypothetical protein